MQLVPQVMYVFYIIPVCQYMHEVDQNTIKCILIDFPLQERLGPMNLCHMQDQQQCSSLMEGDLPHLYGQKVHSLER